MIFKVFSIYFLICFLVVGSITNNFKDSKLVNTNQTTQNDD